MGYLMSQSNSLAFTPARCDGQVTPVALRLLCCKPTPGQGFQVFPTKESQAARRRVVRDQAEVQVGNKQESSMGPCIGEAGGTQESNQGPSRGQGRQESSHGSSRSRGR